VFEDGPERESHSGSIAAASVPEVCRDKKGDGRDHQFSVPYEDVDQWRSLLTN